MMRKVILIVVLGFSSYAGAQGMPAGMQEAVECMSTLDQEALQNFGRQAEKIAKEIKALCEKNDESGARDLGMKYIRELDDNEEVKKLKKCSEMMRKALPSMPIPEIPSAEMYKDETGSICENIK